MVCKLVRRALENPPLQPKSSGLAGRKGRLKRPRFWDTHQSHPLGQSEPIATDSRSVRTAWENPGR